MLHPAPTLTLVALLLCSADIPAAEPTAITPAGSVAAPNVKTSGRPALWDLSALERARTAARQGDVQVAPALAALVRAAEGCLGKPYDSVLDKVSKVTLREGDDPHDFRSVSIYYWPDPANPTAPWTKRDGDRNKAAVELYDSDRLRSSCDRITNGALAWWFTGRTDLGEDAVGQLRHWFLAPATRMNPHLRFAQFVPNVRGETGNAHGLIDTMRLVEMLSALSLLEQGPLMTAEDRAGMRQWVTAYRDWFLTSDLGRAESSANNNHSIYYDLQVVAFSHYLDDQNKVREVLDRIGPKRIAAQIEPDGSMPRELARPIAFTYTCWNMTPLVQMAAMEHFSGHDASLWKWESPDGRSLAKSMRWLTNFTTGATWTWGRPSDPVKPGSIARLLWVLVRSGTAPEMAPALEGLTLPADDRLRLLYPL